MTSLSALTAQLNAAAAITDMAQTPFEKIFASYSDREEADRAMAVYYQLVDITATCATMCKDISKELQGVADLLSKSESVTAEWLTAIM